MLSRAGFDVTVASPDEAGLDELAAATPIRPRPLPGGRHSNVVAWLGAYFIVQGELIDRPVDLVVGVGVPWAFMGAFAGHRAGVSGVVAAFDDPPTDLSLRAVLDRLPQRLRDRADRRTPIAARLSAWSDAIVIRRVDALDPFLAIEGVDRRKVELIPHGEPSSEERLLRLYADTLERAAR